MVRAEGVQTLVDSFLKNGIIETEDILGEVRPIPWSSGVLEKIPAEVLGALGQQRLDEYKRLGFMFVIREGQHRNAALRKLILDEKATTFPLDKQTKVRILEERSTVDMLTLGRVTNHVKSQFVSVFNVIIPFVGV